LTMGVVPGGLLYTFPAFLGILLSLFWELGYHPQPA
jgi:hypothetical protein